MDKHTLLRAFLSPKNIELVIVLIDLGVLLVVLHFGLSEVKRSKVKVANRPNMAKKAGHEHRLLPVDFYLS